MLVIAKVCDSFVDVCIIKKKEKTDQKQQHVVNQELYHNFNSAYLEPAATVSVHAHTHTQT